MSDHRIDPMQIFGPGRCIKCGGQMYVLDVEMTFMDLAPSGSPVNEHTEFRCEATCSLCGSRVPMMRCGLDYIPDTEYSRFIRDYVDMELIRETEARMEALKPTKDNPFCINTERQK